MNCWGAGKTSGKGVICISIKELLLMFQWLLANVTGHGEISVAKKQALNVPDRQTPSDAMT